MYLTRDTRIDVQVKDVPEDMDEIEPWWEGLKANVAGVGTRPLEPMAWFEELERPDSTKRDFPVSPGDKYELLEMHLYKSVMNALKGGPAAKHFEEIKSDQVDFGHGRQCLRCLKISMIHSRYRLAMQANTELSALAFQGVSGINKLEETLTRIRTLRRRSSKPVSDWMDLLRNMMRNIPDARTMVQTHLMKPGHEHNVHLLLLDLDRVVNDHKQDEAMKKAHKSKKEEKAAAALARKKEKHQTAGG